MRVWEGDVCGWVYVWVGWGMLSVRGGAGGLGGHGDGASLNKTTTMRKVLLTMTTL